MSPTAFLYVVLLLIALFKVAEWLAPYDPLAGRGCKLGYVYDGDTVELKCAFESFSARLQGFDTPETTKPRCPEEQAYGMLATERLRALVAHGEVAFTQVGVDKYDRVLIRLTVNGKDVGEQLIQDGLAVPYLGGKRINWCKKLGAANG